MKYKVETSEKSTVTIKITFDKQEWDEANLKAYQQTKHRYSVNGFRKGKAPKHVIELNYGKGVFFEDALNHLYSEHYFAILDKEAENFTAVGQPELSVDNIDENGAVLVAVTPVKPEVKLGAYKGIKIEKVEYNVTDADVEAELKKLQQRNARTVDVTDRAAENGDSVVIDFSGSIDGVKFEGGTAEKHTLVLGSHSFIAGFEEQVAGMKIGEEKDINVTFPEDYQAEELKGKAAVFAVKLHEIKKEELPEVNDEFIKDAAGAESVEAYKAETRARLEKEAEAKGNAETENNIVKAISETAEVEIPQVMIENQIDMMVKNAEYRLSMQYGGLKLDDYLKYMGSNLADFRKGYEAQAKDTVKSQLVIDKILREENIKAEDAEVDAKLEEYAKATGKTLEEYNKSVDASQREYIANDIVINKLFEFLKANNEMTGSAEKPAAKKPAAKKTTTAEGEKKPAAKKTAAKKPTAPTDGEKPAAKKTTAKKPAAKTQSEE